MAFTGIRIPFRAVDEFSPVLNRAQTRLADFGRRVRSIGLVVSGAAAAGGVFARRYAAVGDEIAKTARAAGIGAEEFQAWRFAAGEAGVSASKFERSIKEFQRRLGDAAVRGGASAEAFERLGVSIRDSNGEARDSEEALREAFDALNNLRNETDRNAIAAELFGSNWQRALLLVGQGSQFFDDAEASARSLGIVVGEDALTSLEELNDEFGRFGAISSASFTKIAGAAASAGLTDIIRGLNQEMAGLAESVVRGFDAFSRFFDSGVGILETFKLGLSDAINGTNTLGTALVESARTQREAQAQALENAAQVAQSATAATGEAVGGLVENTKTGLLDVSRTRSRILQDTARTIDAVASLVGGASKRTFRLTQALGVASTIINTHAAIMRALAELGPIAGKVAAVAIAAEGAVQLAAIKSASFEGGGSAPTVSLGDTSGGTATTAGLITAPAATGAGVGGGFVGNNASASVRVELTNVRDIAEISPRDVRAVVAAVNDAVNNGDLSRNARPIQISV